MSCPHPSAADRQLRLCNLDEPTHIRVDQPLRAGREDFVATVSVDVRTGRVVDAAPILRSTLGRDWDAVKDEAREAQRGWKLERVGK